MKREEVILRLWSKQLTFWEAATILRVSPRHLRRLLNAYRRMGFDGLYDRRRARPSARRVPVRIVEQVLGLYREKYFDFSVRHFCEKLREEHHLQRSYTWVKQLLQGAGLVARAPQRGVHRRRRERRAMAGMMLHIDASTHRWLGGEEDHDLLVILDDATSEVYYAQLVEQESTETALGALRAVVEQRGIFCSLYSDRASHFWRTPKAGEPVDRQRQTQVGRALRELGIAMIPAYSPQARGRSERNFGTWQRRLPQELRLRGVTTREEANRFLRESYIAEFNRRFAVAAGQPESAFLPLSGQDLERIFSLQHERVVNRDNTVQFGNRVLLQIERVHWRGTLAGCRVLVCEHQEGAVSVWYGPHCVAQCAPPGVQGKAVEKPLRGKPTAGFPLRLEIPPTARDSHFPTAPAAGHLHPSEQHPDGGPITCS
ncbi:MAG TPA: ISNCY family transposase [Terriglobales bacterium]|nr:ISNCY family transposase [Terriglobales bacterium]